MNIQAQSQRQKAIKPYFLENASYEMLSKVWNTPVIKANTPQNQIFRNIYPGFSVHSKETLPQVKKTGFLFGKYAVSKISRQKKNN